MGVFKNHPEKSRINILNVYRRLELLHEVYEEYNSNIYPRLRIKKVDRIGEILKFTHYKDYSARFM